MRKLAYSVLAVFYIVAVSGKPYSQYGNVTDVPKEEIPFGPDQECTAAAQRDTCSPIFIDAVGGSNRRYQGLLYSFQYYCRKIPGFVPCLKENKANYMLLMECGLSTGGMVNMENIMSPDEQWDISINLLNTVNDIICSRTNELVDLVECIQNDDKAFHPLVQSCITEHGFSLMNMMLPGEPIEPAMLCGAIYGFASCMRDGMAIICEDSSDLLDTFYDDVVVGVIGDGIGCEEAPNPLLSFVRSMRDKLRR